MTDKGEAAMKDMKQALSASLKAEDSKFSKADRYFEENEGTHKKPSLAEPEIKSQRVELKRDSFTFPLEDYSLIESIQSKCLRQEVRANKAEVLRAALRVLDSLSDEEIAQRINALERIKTGRPKMK